MERWKMLVVLATLVVIASFATTASKVCFSVPVCKHPKMSTEVAEMIPPPGIAPPPKPIIVNIYLKENKTEYIKKLENYTTEILYIEGNRIVAEIYTSEILDIVDLPFVTYMDTPLQAQLFSIASEGLRCINVSGLHNYGITGKGIKVAIVDLGFEGYEDLLGKELPKNVTVRSFRTDGDISGGTPHGTACAEIVHDVAPDAELYLINYDGYDYQLEAIIDYLISENVSVVSHSAGHSAGLFDGTDIWCRIIDDAVSNHNITWVNSAGNYAQRHWEGIFTDNDGDGWHEYSCNGGELGQAINVTRGEGVIVFLSWNETWGNATQDYDLYILNPKNNLIVRSVNPQNGSVGQIPVERVSFIAPYSGTYYILIQNYSATKPVHFELYSAFHNLRCEVENSSLCTEATAFGAIVAGAVNSKDCSSLEPYSSRGPTNDGRIKPDFVGPDCVSTKSYSSKNPLCLFCGTSASAPYVAGAIALELSATNVSHFIEVCKEEMCLQAQSIKDLSTTNSTQKDNLYGYGMPRFCFP